MEMSVRKKEFLEMMVNNVVEQANEYGIAEIGVGGDLNDVGKLRARLGREGYIVLRSIKSSFGRADNGWKYMLKVSNGRLNQNA